MGVFSVLIAGIVAFSVAAPVGARSETSRTAAPSASIDPCAAGTFAPPLSWSAPGNPADYPRYAGSDPVPERGFEDPCGLRASDLSGVWLFNGYQAVAYHDLRSGDFIMRFTHIDEDRDYAKTWGYAFGDLILEGRIGNTRDETALTVHSRFPLSSQAQCPDDAFEEIPVQYLRLSYDAYARRQIDLTRRWGRLENAGCVVTHERFITDLLVQAGPESDR